MLTKRLKCDTIEAYSAGIEPHSLNPDAVHVMDEVDVAIGGHVSKMLDEFTPIEFDYLVTVCGNAQETSSVFPDQAQVILRGFDDPPVPAKTSANEREALGHYRRVCDESRVFVELLPEALLSSS